MGATCSWGGWAEVLGRGGSPWSHKGSKLGFAHSITITYYLCSWSGPCLVVLNLLRVRASDAETRNPATAICKNRGQWG